MPESSDDSAESMTVELRFYASFREAVGQKSVTYSLSGQVTVSDALARAIEEFPDLDGEILDESGQISDGVRALRNGRERADADTRLEDGDDVTFTMPIHGG